MSEYLTPKRKSVIREVVGRPEVAQTLVDLAVLGAGFRLSRRLAQKGVRRQIGRGMRRILTPRRAKREIARRRGLALELQEYRKSFRSRGIGPKERKYIHAALQPKSGKKLRHSELLEKQLALPPYPRKALHLKGRRPPRVGGTRRAVRWLLAPKGMRLEGKVATPVSVALRGLRR